MKFKTFIFLSAVILMFISAKGELKNYFSENQLWWIEAICMAIVGWRIGDYNTMLENKKTVDQAITECELITKTAILAERIKMLKRYLGIIIDGEEKRKLEEDIKMYEKNLEEIKAMQAS